MIKSVKVSNRLYCYNPKGTRDNKILKCSCARASVWKMLLVTSQSVFCKDLEKYEAQHQSKIS